MMRRLLLAALLCAAADTALANNYQLFPVEYYERLELPGWFSELPHPSSIGRRSMYIGRTKQGAQLLLKRGVTTFQLPANVPLDYVVVRATLNLSAGYFESSDPMETVGVYEVTAPISQLAGSGNVNAAIFEDLGSGTFYGSGDLSFARPYVTFNLNTAAIDAINNRRPDLISFGFSLQSLNSSYVRDEMLWGARAEIQLLFAPVPEPSTFAIAATGLIGLWGTGRRRAFS